MLSCKRSGTCWTKGRTLIDLTDREIRGFAGYWISFEKPLIKTHRYTRNLLEIFPLLSLAG